MSRLRRCRIWIEGRVQGVGYRNYATRRARRLGIRGYVRNLPDGRVEAVAEGSERALAAFLRELELGPRRARVDAVHCIDEPGTDELGPFRIKG